MQFWLILGMVIAIFLLAILGMAVRVIFIKGAEARGGCAGKNPMLLKEGVACGMCGAKPGEECKSES